MKETRNKIKVFIFMFSQMAVLSDLIVISETCQHYNTFTSTFVSQSSQGRKTWLAKMYKLSTHNMKQNIDRCWTTSREPSWCRKFNFNNRLQFDNQPLMLSTFSQTWYLCSVRNYSCFPLSWYTVNNVIIW